jgi:hypothetical protein
MRKIALGLGLALVLPGCAAQTAAKQDYAVKVSYKYAANDQSASAWRAFMIALDKCHDEGYQDAYPAGQPRASCERSSGNTCIHFAADATYDCVGLSYQTN